MEFRQFLIAGDIAGLPGLAGAAIGIVHQFADNVEVGLVHLSVFAV